MLAAGAEDGKIEVWNVDTEELLHTLECEVAKRYCHTQQIPAVAMSKDGRFVASIAGYDKVDEAAAEIVLWDTQDGPPDP